MVLTNAASITTNKRSKSKHRIKINNNCKITLHLRTYLINDCN